MTDALPDPRSPDPHDPIEPAAVVLPAVAFEPPLDERRPWLEDHEIVDALEVPGLETPLYLTADDVAVTTTGLGKSEAATTVATLAATAGIDLESAYVLSVGIAGSSPSKAALGSVVLADAVVDWDRKHRWDPEDGGDSSIDVLAYSPEKSVHHVDDDLLEVAREAASDVDLAEDEAVLEYQRRYPGTPDTPSVGVGPTVTGDEFWHGPALAEEVEWFCRQYDLEGFVTTQMEDAATMTTLERVGLAGQYLSVRAVANYDRPAPDQSVEDSFEGPPESLELAIENAAAVGSAVVGRLVEEDPLGLRAEN
ncbi:phosphorylase family protein [Natrialbaceae archaeon A-gly3]